MYGCQNVQNALHSILQWSALCVHFSWVYCDTPLRGNAPAHYGESHCLQEGIGHIISHSSRIKPSFYDVDYNTY